MKLATTTCDFNKTRSTAEDRIRGLYGAGFRHIDLSDYNIPGDTARFEGENWREEAKKIRYFAESLGMDFVQAHSPGGNPLSRDDKFDKLLETTIRSVEVCAELGIPQTVVHAGWASGIGRDEYFERNLEFYRMLFPVMEKTGVMVLIENSTKANMGENWYFLTGGEMRDFIDYAGHPLLGAVWDTGHANCEGHQYSDLIALGDALKGVHIHDNRGKLDEHMPIWSGTINMDEVMEGLIDSGYVKRGGVFTFEVDSTVINAGNWLHRRSEYKGGSRLLNPPDEVLVKAEEMLHVTGEYILRQYGLFEEGD